MVSIEVESQISWMDDMEYFLKEQIEMIASSEHELILRMVDSNKSHVFDYFDSLLVQITEPRMSLNLIDLLRPAGNLFPSVLKPLGPINIQQKTIYTAIALFIYLICSQIPLYGIQRSYESDPLYWARVILASSKGTLMELGISPIISAGWAIQIIEVIGLIKINSPKDSEISDGLEKILALIFCFGEAAGSVWMGAYGQTSQMTIITISLIIAQLMMAGVVVILLDDLLRKGYGLGSGISLFIVANTSEVIFWSMLSPVTMSSQFGVEFEGSLICLVHFLYSKDNKWTAFYSAFTRQNGNNLFQLCGSLLIFFILIYLQRFHIKVRLIHQKYNGYKKDVTIKLFFTSNMSVILQSLLISNFYKLSEYFYTRFQHTNIVKLIGVWESGKITGGMLWFISPPEDMIDALMFPVRTILYTGFVCFLCANLARFWIIINKSTPKDYALYLRAEELTLQNYKEKSVIGTLQQNIPIAAMLGGAIIGFLTVVGDLIDVAGSSTGIMLSISILYSYYEKMVRKPEVLTEF